MHTTAGGEETDMEHAGKEMLIERIRDLDPARRAEAAYQMGLAGDPSFLPLLEETLQDQDSKVRWRGIQAIGKFDLRDPPARILPLLGDPSPQVRAEAVTVLGHWRRKEDVEVLSPLLEDPDPQVRYRTLEALGEIREVGEPLLDRIVSLLEDPNGSIRMHAVLALGKCRYRTAVPFLIRRLKDPLHTVRGPAAWSLGELRDDSALRALVELLHDEGEFVRIYVYQAIASFGKRALPVLKETLAAGSPGSGVLLERLLDEILEGVSVGDGP